MKKTVFTIPGAWLLLMLLLAAPGMLAAKDQASPTPVAVMPETVYEFPATPDGAYVIHDFVIRNQGDADLNVLKVKIT